MVEGHLQGGVRGLVRLLNAALQQGEDVVSEHGDGEAKQGRARMAEAAEFAVQRALEPLEHALNGLIANDKFCWARTLQLHLSWSRARCKLKPPTPRHLSAEAIPHGAEHAAEAHLARPADRRADGDRPAALGPGLPASPAMGGNAPSCADRGARAPTPAGDVSWRVAIYGRVSTGHRVEQQTIEQQIERLTAQVATHATEGWTLEPAHVFRDDGYSGASLARPGLDRLRDAVKGREV